jgi:hypothetical protein
MLKASTQVKDARQSVQDTAVTLQGFQETGRFHTESRRVTAQNAGCEVVWRPELPCRKHHHPAEGHGVPSWAECGHGALQLRIVKILLLYG